MSIVHPKYSYKNLVDFNLAFTLLPSLLLGNYFGFHIILVSPNIALFTLLVVIFLGLNYSVISKYNKNH